MYQLISSFLETITFNKNSLHYHLVKNYPGRFEYEIKEDLCGYIRQFIFSLFESSQP